MMEYPEIDLISMYKIYMEIVIEAYKRRPK